MLPVPICFYPHCPLLLFHPLPLLEVPCPSPWLNYQRSLTNRLVSTRRASIDRSGRVHYHLTGHSFAVVQLHPRKPCHAICIELHQNLSPTSNDFQNPCDPFPQVLSSALFTLLVSFTGKMTCNVLPQSGLNPCSVNFALTSTSSLPVVYLTR